MAIPEINEKLAERYLMQRNVAAADSFFARALRYYPNPVIEARSRLGLAYIALAHGDYSESIDHYERVLNLLELYNLRFDGMADVQLNVGLAYLQRSKSESGNGNVDLRRARSSFREALDLDPTGEAGITARKQLEAID